MTKMMARYYMRFAIAIHAVANLTIGISLLLWVNLSAENILSNIMPPWVWPSMFIAAGIVALFGIGSRSIAQFAYVFAGIVTLVFGAASAYAMYSAQTLVPTASTVFLVYIAIMKFEMAYLIEQRESIIESILKVTSSAQSALEHSQEHGRPSTE